MNGVSDPLLVRVPHVQPKGVKGLLLLPSLGPDRVGNDV